MLKRSRSYSCALLLSLLATACERAPEQNGASAVQPQAANMPSGSMPLASVPPAPAAPSAREALPEPIAEVAQPEPVSPAGPRVMTSHSRAQRAGVAPMPARAAEMDFAIGSGAVDGAGAPAAKSAMARRAVSPRDDAPAGEGFNTEAYAASEETPFLSAKDSPLSTFSIDVDSASYSNVRRFLAERQLPPSGAVRVEELINYFPYPYPEPSGNTPFSLNTEISTAPWDSSHELLLVGLQAKRIASSALPPRNLVFLIDVSGSMFEPNKLPLVKRSLATLVDTLTERDQIAMVVYAGNSGLVLPPTSGDRHAEIRAALDRLEAGGSTNGAQGIELAYAEAERMARPGSLNRVVLATDGDFNVGVTSQSELLSLIETKRKSGTYLSVLGFGMGNYKDSTLELLADKGNGNYAYIDTLAEARKVLVAQAGATLSLLAKDVKLQLEFNPEKVGAYRLIGYEDRRLAARDFNDDAKDAGDLGAGQAVTALYEIVPPGVAVDSGHVDALRYQAPVASVAGHAGELCTLKVRYKAPSSERSELVQQVVQDTKNPLDATSPSFRFASAVAVFGMSLRHSPARGSSSFALARQLADGALGSDAEGYRHEFLGLLDTARSLKP